MITNEDKKEMIRLYYIEKKTCSAIAKLFSLDHTTVLYHLKRIGKKIQNRTRKNLPILSHERTPIYRYRKNVPNPVIGKTYRDYVKESMQKQFVRDAQGSIIKIIDLPTPTERDINRRITGVTIGDITKLEKEDSYDEIIITSD